MGIPCSRARGTGTIANEPHRFGLQLTRTGDAHTVAVVANTPHVEDICKWLDAYAHGEVAVFRAGCTYSVSG